MEKAVQIQLMDYLEANNLLTTYQFGYQPKRSTKEAVTIMHVTLAERSIEENLATETQYFLIC